MPIGGSVGGEKGCSLPVAGPRYFSLRKPGELRRTRDIGIKGVFVICDTLPPVGTALSLEVYLPPLERNTMQRLHLEAAGKVIRVDVGEESSGSAATAHPPSTNGGQVTTLT